jgi:glutathione S-transferase
MKLYADPRSPNCAKVLFAAAHLGVELEVEDFDLAQGQHRTAQFRDLNPNCKVPVLVDGDFVLWESNAILQYLCSVAGPSGASALPTDARSNADTMRWLFWSSEEWRPVVRPFLWERIVKPLLGLGNPDAHVLAAAEAPFQQALAVVDRQLTGKQYLVGECLTLADIGVSSYLMYAERAQLPLDGARHVQAWFDRIKEMPAWRRSQPRSLL